VRTVITGVTLAFLAVLLWFGVTWWRVRFQTFASLDLSMAWAYAALPVGAACSSHGGGAGPARRPGERRTRNAQ
jgi:TRAP-type C4-dicarboxylate transport system permease small subunit